MANFDRARYEASKFDLEAIRRLAKRVVAETKKPKTDERRWLLTTRQQNTEKKIKGHFGPTTEGYWSVISYYLRDDGDITKNWVEGFDSIYDPNRPLSHGSEEVLVGDNLLFFDFKPRYRDFWYSGTHCVNNRDASNKLEVATKGLGITQILRGMLPQGVASQAPMPSSPTQTRVSAPHPPVQPQVVAPVVSKPVRPSLTESEQGIENLRRTASRGDATAGFTLGQYYEKGREGLPVNLDNARLWYYLASKKGHAGALAAYNRLG